MFIVTAGKAFNDIDAFGCAIAYAELLRLEGKDAKAVFVGPLNHSVTPLALEQSVEYLTEYVLKPEDRIVYVDLSGPDHLAFPDTEGQIDELYDHHYGHEEYWKERLGERSHIERVGAAGTLIWEEFVKRGFADTLSAPSANVLLLAILQNTLNFTSTETNDRDRAAFNELVKHSDFPLGWQERYFAESAKAMEQDFHAVLVNDTKILENSFGDQRFVFSQLEITEDPRTFFGRHKTEIDTYWSSFQNKRCLVNIADMASRTSLLYSDDLHWLATVIKPLFAEATSTDDAILIPIHQRKQILKLLEHQV
jgi:inorganic pyrophosphatase/exopolyphosphatase